MKLCCGIYTAIEALRFVHSRYGAMRPAESERRKKAEGLLSRFLSTGAEYPISDTSERERGNRQKRAGALLAVGNDFLAAKD